MFNFRSGTSVSKVMSGLFVEIVVFQAVASLWGHFKFRLPFVSENVIRQVYEVI